MCPKGFHVVRNEASADAPATAELLFYDVIGFDLWTGGGITARAVAEALASLDGVSELHVRINSPGGDVIEGVGIYNALARFGGRVIVHGDGMVASIATVIAMAGDEIRTAENSIWMVHHPFTLAAGDAPEMRRVADILDRYWNSILATYSRRTGRKKATLADRVTKADGREWWMSAEEAVAEGFADKVVQPEKDAAAMNFSGLRRVPERFAAAASVSTDATQFREPRAAPELVELEAPRVSATREPDGDDEEQVRRRRHVEVLKLL